MASGVDLGVSERRAIRVTGIVQGVGFRPYVYALARRLGLRGSVRNQSGSVRIEVEGEPGALDRFLVELPNGSPALARIESLTWSSEPPRGERVFRIEPSAEDREEAVFVSPDVATCPDCLRELFDPADRRYLYPFLNCTQCGPRLTIVLGAPYDRERTSLAGFPLCSPCREEYEHPANRRFHAQATACGDCGPRLIALRRDGRGVLASDPVSWFAAEMRKGKVGALKGLGGYHLVCDAGNETAVAELRRRKHRDEKPFAIMVEDLARAERLAAIDGEERSLLLSARRPIVLLRKRGDAPLAEAVAPGNPFVGILLPYTPLHHLLLRRAGGGPLVMTSGNRSDEPMAYRDDEALERLGSIADVFLAHDRPIQVRCDDSVTRVLEGAELPLRRSRGYAPAPLRLPRACPAPTLALGGQLKATFALGRDDSAFVSHHIGDLEDYGAYRSYLSEIALYEELFSLRPEILVHDLHPDYASTHYAAERARSGGLAAIAVQHHHAHMASCMAENGLDRPVIGVSFDGTGFGTDGAIWGGEILVGDYRGFERAAHLRYVALPGGEKAIREPWRMALSHLRDAGRSAEALEDRIPCAEIGIVETMIARGLNAPPTSSMGRLFDAVASLAAMRDRVSYEGQAAMELEWSASAGGGAERAYPFDLEGERPIRMDTRPLIRAILADRDAGLPAPRIARRFHATVTAMTREVCERLRRTHGLDVVVLSGGCFQNALLTRDLSAALAASGFTVYRHRRVPPNDGGLSLGQLAVAAARGA